MMKKLMYHNEFDKQKKILEIFKSTFNLEDLHFLNESIELNIENKINNSKEKIRMVIENITNGYIIFQEDIPVGINSSEEEIENYTKKTRRKYYGIL